GKEAKQSKRRSTNRRSRMTTKSGTAFLALAAAAGATSAFLAHSTAQAATKFWGTSTAGNWSTASNWVGNSVPAATGDTINITDPAAGIKTATFDGSVTTTSMAALTVGGSTNTFTGSMTLLFPAGSTKTVAVTGATSVGGTSTGAGAQGTITQ